MREEPHLFTASTSVSSERILYTPSPFARANLLHLQEAGSLRALSPRIRLLPEHPAQLRL